jgi:environmental stress-induced protein Ves
MTRHRLLAPADYRRMRWKNAAGWTTEVAAFPDGAGLDAFDWRVSVTDVAGDGPFSRFPGVDRAIVVLAGAGMRLGGDHHAAVLRPPGEPYLFSGDDAIHCTLVNGPVRDFNLMLRRGRATGEVSVLRAASARIAPARFRLCYAATGACEGLVAGRPPLVVASDHALLIEEDAGAAAAPLVVNPLAADAVVLAVRIDLVA